MLLPNSPITAAAAGTLQALLVLHDTPFGRFRTSASQKGADNNNNKPLYVAGLSYHTISAPGSSCQIANTVMPPAAGLLLCCVDPCITQPVRQTCTPGTAVNVTHADGSESLGGQLAAAAATHASHRVGQSPPAGGAGIGAAGAAAAGALAQLQSEGHCPVRALAAEQVYCSR